MVDDNEISLGNDIHMELLWFVFSSLLQTDLDKVRVEWNTHYIRRTRHETVPGRPDELFFLPEDSGFTEQGKYISVHDVEEAYSGEENLLEDGESFATAVDEELTEYFKYVVENECLDYPPRNWLQGKELFNRKIQLAY